MIFDDFSCKKWGGLVKHSPSGDVEIRLGSRSLYRILASNVMQAAKNIKGRVT
jgi:hypothetical protein